MPQSWVESCVASVVRAAFAVGDRQVSFATCAQAQSGKDSCYGALVAIIHGYIPNPVERVEVCSKIEPALWRKKCIQDDSA